MSRIAQILKEYNLGETLIQTHNLLVREAVNKESGLKCAVKLYKKADSELSRYLQKMKTAGSEYVVKIYQIYNEPQTNQLLILQELPSFGTLAKALRKCKRLEAEDAVFVTKLLLNGHIDLLRSGINWTGTEADIQITDFGIKLSWNDSIAWSQNNPNPFPSLISKIGERPHSNAILSFPENKMLNDLITVSKENASEMSLHPLLKKREKIFRKKGKNWLALKQTKIKGEYPLQQIFFAINPEHGFVRIKIAQRGFVHSQLIKIHQTNPSFVKIIQNYEEGENFVIMSQYANDGNVQNFVRRLKNANILLRQQQIQFIFYSLIQPLKIINKSSVISLNILNIKNIYLQDGIPKIGEVTPLSVNLIEKLKERTDVPDFYHREFKQNPESKSPRFDTYSLGVLLYKLMFTEYPIFPQSLVHIPTTPVYKKTLIDALRLFLDRGGILSEIVQQLQISQVIRQQIKNNQRKLHQLQQHYSRVVDKESEISNKQILIKEDEDEQQLNCKNKFKRFFMRRSKDNEQKYLKLQQSQNAFYRKCTSVIVILLLYFLCFFIFYCIGFFNLITTTRLFTRTGVNILGQTHYVIIPNYDAFYKAYSSTNNTNIAALSGTLGCIIDDNGSYFDFVRPASPHWYIYLVLSFVTMITILILKGLQIYHFSLSTAARHYYDETVIGQNETKYARSSYIFVQLWFSLALYCFYYLFNFIFLQQHSPCFGGNNWSELTKSLFTDRIDFTLKYLIIILITFFFGLLSFIQVVACFHKIKYDMLLNPIFIFILPYLGLVVTMRIGALNFFQPSFINNNGFIGNSYLNFVGYFPQLLVLVQIALVYFIDYIFYKCIDSKLEQFFVTHETQIQINDKIDQ